MDALQSMGMPNPVQFLLVFVRTLGIFTLTPIFGQSQVPVQVRILASVCMTFVFAPMAHPAAPLPSELLGIAALALREVVIGLTIGFVVTLVFSALHIAGDIVDTHVGFSFASIVDPVYGSQTALAARLHQMIASVLFFVMNCHHVLIRGLSDSFRIAPIGVFSLNPSVSGGVMDLFVSMLLIALRVSVPVVAAVALADVALAVTSKAVPQMNVLMVGFPLKLGVGLVGMIVALPLLVSTSQGVLGSMYGHTAAILHLAAR